jgi:hypothetical protein
MLAPNTAQILPKDVWISKIYFSLMRKILVSIEEELLRRVDRVARSRGLSRSAYLTEIAERDVTRSLGPGRDLVARRSLRRLDRLFADTPRGDSTAAIRAERDAR